MMQLLLPLGLLGLLGVLALIIVYVIRPNYETRHINSTHIWKLSLQYKKRRLPTSKLRNVLLFLCQVLILLAMTMILAKPAIVYEAVGDDSELIAVLDSSMSMYTQSPDGVTRFDRAVDKVIADCNTVVKDGGRVSVIVAADTPRYLRQRISEDGLPDLVNALNELKEGENGKDSHCGYGASDLDAAMLESEKVLEENPYARVKVYTDKTYGEFGVPQNVTIETIRGEGEWNIGILDAQAELDDDHYYRITVQIASYGADCYADLTLQVTGADALDAAGGGRSLDVSVPVRCLDVNDGGQVMTVVFHQNASSEAGNPAGSADDVVDVELGLTERFSTFLKIEVFVMENDSLGLDNSVILYGGLKETVNVQYASGSTLAGQASANPFINGILPVLHDAFADRWNIMTKEVGDGARPELEGYNVYIFEHSMPERLPDDGVVILFDPDRAPEGSDIIVTGELAVPASNLKFAAEESAEEAKHPLLNNLRVDNIEATFIKTLEFSADSGYEVLMTCNGRPVMLARDDGALKTIVLGFSVHNSNLVMLPEWFILMHNIFDTYLPSTVVGETFDVNEEIEVNARGPRTTVTREGGSMDPIEIESFPATVTADAPGTYTFETVTYFNERVTSSVFVRPPREESNINAQEETIEDPFAAHETYDDYNDLLVWFAAALVALLFVEWALHSREKN